MPHDQNLKTIREKIEQLKTAIMYSSSDNEINLPNTIVTAIKVDDEGRLWFTCQDFSQPFFTGNEGFPARLHFYRKGVPYHLEISGKAELVNVINSGVANEALFGTGVNMMLFRMSMIAVECTEVTDKKNKTRFEQALENGYNWMLRHISFQPSRQSAPRWPSYNH